MSDLVKRLRATATGENTRPLRTEAADALEVALARVRELEAVLREDRKDASLFVLDAHDCSRMIRRIDAALRAGGAEGDTDA